MKAVRLSGLLALVFGAACSSGGGDSTGPGGGGGGGGGAGGGGGVTCPAGAVCMLSAVYSPRLLTVNSGSAVTFINDSGISHTVTFDDPRSPGVTDIGLHSSGSNSRTFTQAGRFPFHCTEHGGMTGEITVN